MKTTRISFLLGGCFFFLVLLFLRVKYIYICTSKIEHFDYFFPSHLNSDLNFVGMDCRAETHLREKQARGTYASLP